MIQSIYIELTDVCNLCCRHCYNASGKKNIKKYILPSLIKKIVEECSKNQKVIVSLSGGEPFLHPNIIEIIEMLSVMNCQIGIATNGLLLTEKNMQYLNSKNVSLQISIDGTKEIHEFIRGEGTYSAIIEQLKKLSKHYNMQNLAVKAVLNKKLLGKTGDYVEKMMDMNVGRVEFGDLSHSGRAKGSFFKEYALESEELIKINAEIEKLQEKYPGRIGKTYACFSCGLLHESDPLYNLRVDVDGDVYTCQGFNDKEFSIGNLYENTVDEMLNGEVYNCLIRNLRLRQDSIACEKCILYRTGKCKKGCPAEEINLNGWKIGFDGKCKYRVSQYMIELLKKKQSEL